MPVLLANDVTGHPAEAAATTVATPNHHANSFATGTGEASFPSPPPPLVVSSPSAFALPSVPAKASHLPHRDLQIMLNEVAPLFVIEESHQRAKQTSDPALSATKKCDPARWRSDVKTLWLIPQTVRQINLVRQLHDQLHYAVDRNSGRHFLQQAGTLHGDPTCPFAVKIVPPSSSFFSDSSGGFLTVHNHVPRSLFKDTKEAIAHLQEKGVKDRGRNNLVANYGYTGLTCPTRSQASRGLIMPSKMEGSMEPFAVAHHAQLTRMLDTISLPCTGTHLAPSLHGDAERNAVFAHSLAGSSDQRCAFEASTLHLSAQVFVRNRKADVSQDHARDPLQSWAEWMFRRVLKGFPLSPEAHCPVPEDLLDIHCDTNNDRTNAGYSPVLNAIEWALDTDSPAGSVLLRCGRSGYGKQSCADHMDQLRLHGPTIDKVVHHFHHMPPELKQVPTLPPPNGQPVQLPRPHLNKAGAYYAAFGMSIRKFLATFPSVQDPKRWAAAFHVIMTKEGHRPLVWHHAMEHLMRNMADYLPPHVSIDTADPEDIVWKHYTLLFEWTHSKKSNGICGHHRMQPFHNSPMSKDEFHRGTHTILTLSAELADLGNKLEDFNYLRNVYHRTVQLMCMHHDVGHPSTGPLCAAYGLCGIRYVGHLSVHLVIGSAAIVGLFPSCMLGHAEVPVSTNFEKIYEGTNLQSANRKRKDLYSHTQDLLRAIAFVIAHTTAIAEELICQVKSVNTSEQDPNPHNKQHQFSDTLIPGVPFLVYNGTLRLIEAHVHQDPATPRGAGKAVPSLLRPLSCLVVNNAQDKTAVMGPQFWLIPWPDLRTNPATKRVAANFCSLKHFFPTRLRRVHVAPKGPPQTVRSQLLLPQSTKAPFSVPPPAAPPPNLPFHGNGSPSGLKRYLMESTFDWSSPLRPVQILTTLDGKPCQSLDPIGIVLDHFSPREGKKRSKDVFLTRTMVKKETTLLHDRSTFGFPKDHTHPPFRPAEVSSMDSAMRIQLSHCFQLFPCQIQEVIQHFQPMTRKKCQKFMLDLHDLASLGPTSQLRTECLETAASLGLNLTMEQKARAELTLWEFHPLQIKVPYKRTEVQRLTTWDPPLKPENHRPTPSVDPNARAHLKQVSLRRKRKQRKKAAQGTPSLSPQAVSNCIPSACCPGMSSSPCGNDNCRCHAADDLFLSPPGRSTPSKKLPGTPPCPPPEKKKGRNQHIAAVVKCLVEPAFPTTHLHSQCAVQSSRTFYCAAIRLQGSPANKAGPPVSTAPFSSAAPFPPTTKPDHGACAYHADPGFPLFKNDGTSFFDIPSNCRYFSNPIDAKIFVSLQYIFDHRDKFCHRRDVANLWSLSDELYQSKAREKHLADETNRTKRIAASRRKHPTTTSQPSKTFPAASSFLRPNRKQKKHAAPPKPLAHEQEREAVFWRTFRIRQLSGSCLSTTSSLPNLVAVSFRQGGVAHYLLNTSDCSKISEYHLSRPFPCVPMPSTSPPSSSVPSDPGSEGSICYRPFVSIKDHEATKTSLHLKVQPLNETNLISIPLQTMRCHAPAECYDYAKEHDILHLPGFRSLKHIKRKIDTDAFDSQAKRRAKRSKTSALAVASNSLPTPPTSLLPGSPNPAAPDGNKPIPGVPASVCEEVLDLGRHIKGDHLTWADIGAPACARCRWTGCDRCFQKFIGADL